MQRDEALHSFELFYVYASLLNLLNNLQWHARCFHVYERFFEEACLGESGTLKIKTTGSKGQISVALILVMTVILGAIGLGADMALLYFNWVILQKGVDAAALAGAGTSRATRVRASGSHNRQNLRREEWHQGCRIDHGRQWQRGLRPGSQLQHHHGDRQAHRALHVFQIDRAVKWQSGRPGDRPDATGAGVRELHQRDSHARGSAHRHPGKHLQHRRPMRRASDRPRLEHTVQL